VLRLIGYWASVDGSVDVLGYPHPASLVEPHWQHERRQRIAQYLKDGHELVSYMGVAPCRFADCSQRNGLGSRDLTDGQWLWPEGLAHYVLTHDVRLPDEFVAAAAELGFIVPSARLEQRSVDRTFWLRWSAANTPPPAAGPDACTFEAARATCDALGTSHWRASLTEAHERWKLEIVLDGVTFEDYTGPISDRQLRRYLFQSRKPDNEAVLEGRVAWQIAAEYDVGARKARPLGGSTASDGTVWWAIITANADRDPTTPLEHIDIKSTRPPEPGWAVFMPGGWRMETKPGMDEPAWRFFLEEWRSGLRIPEG
jgi:hypothetical protein